MKKVLGVLVTFVLLIGMTTAVHATTILYDVNNLSGTRFEYTYFVTNDTLVTDIEEFTIFFDLGLYDNLMVTTPLGDWSEVVANPDPFLPDDGFYDALASVAGIALGSTVSGFSVSFDWLGVGIPNDQRFEVVDPENFNVLDSGNTSSIPEPSTVLLAVGFIGLVGIRKKFQYRT